MLKFLNKSKLDARTTERLGDILVIATRFSEDGVVDWVDRAYTDACKLGKLRDRDVATLIRLEDTFNGHYYKSTGERIAFKQNAYA